MSTTLLSRLRVRPRPALTPLNAANFLHLYWDVMWYGVAFGSTLSFLPVFAARLGASGWQIGMLSAGPALVGVILTLPAGRWLEGRPLKTAVFWAAFLQRLGLFCLIPAPLLLPTSMQIWATLALTLLMAIPGTVLMVGFNALLATTVPPESRSMVVGRRNSLLAAAIMVTFIASGWLLTWLPFEWGYALVFIIGAGGGALSTYHIARLQVPPLRQFSGQPLKDYAQPGRGIGFSGTIPQRVSSGLRLLLHWRPSLSDTLETIPGQYWKAMIALFLFHFTQMIPAALFPIFWVHEANLNDSQIGWINAIFYLAMLAAAPLLAPLALRVGNFRLMASGAILLGSYPLLTALSYGMPLLVITSITGGIIWAILSGAQINRLLEITPEDNRASHLAVYNLALNLALLSGPLVGPWLAGAIGLREALIAVALVRFASGLILSRWG